MVATTEREMLQEYILAKKDFEKIEKTFDDAKKLLEEKESVLVNALMDKGAKATAQWDGMGHFVLLTPKLRASYLKENEQEVFSLVAQEGRQDMIKESISPASLSSFVKGMIERGIQLPEFIKYYEQQNGKLVPEKMKV